MQPKDRTQERASPPIDADRGVAPATRQTWSRRRIDIAAQIPAMQIRRIIVLAERFQELCALRSDPMRLIDLLRSLISCTREAFIGEPRTGVGVARKCRPSAEQLNCLEDLELLMQALVRGAPEASRGLAHAMDALLIQCVVFAATARDTADAAAAARD